MIKKEEIKTGPEKRKDCPSTGIHFHDEELTLIEVYVYACNVMFLASLTVYLCLIPSSSFQHAEHHACRLRRPRLQTYSCPRGTLCGLLVACRSAWHSQEQTGNTNLPNGPFGGCHSISLTLFCSHALATYQCWVELLSELLLPWLLWRHCLVCHIVERQTSIQPLREESEKRAWLPEQTNNSNVITEWMDKVLVLSIGTYGLGSGEELARRGKRVREEKREWSSERVAVAE